MRVWPAKLPTIAEAAPPAPQLLLALMQGSPGHTLLTHARKTVPGLCSAHGSALVILVMTVVVGMILMFLLEEGTLYFAKGYDTPLQLILKTAFGCAAVTMDIITLDHVNGDQCFLFLLAA